MWLDAGILDRELSLYKNHASKGIKVTILSFGRANDHNLVKQYNNIQFLTNKWNFPTWLYAVLIPVLFRHCDIEFSLKLPTPVQEQIIIQP